MNGRTSPARLAIDGGAPVRARLLPYATPDVGEAEIAAVVAVLQSGWLTTGPKVAELEAAFAARTGAREAVAVSSGTAALHGIMHMLGIGPGDEVIVPAISFAATANCVAMVGAKPVFADVDEHTLLVTAETIAARKSPRTRAIVGVDFAGQPCDYAALRVLAETWQVPLVADSCHALGATYRGAAIGSLADLTAFSLHAVKHVAAGEGGMVTTDNPQWADRLRRFRNHGIDADHRARAAEGSWFYQLVELGYNYRLTDLQSALALVQLERLDESLARRRAIVARYDAALADTKFVRPLTHLPFGQSAHHLYVVRLDLECWTVDRRQVFQALRAEGIGVNVHYVPIHLHPYYRQTWGTAPGDCPVAERVYEEILSLPLFPAMSDADVADTLAALEKVWRAYARPARPAVAVRRQAG